MYFAYLYINLLKLMGILPQISHLFYRNSLEKSLPMLYIFLILLFT